MVQKESGESQPNFMRFFAKEDQQKKGRKQPMAGPQNISYFFPDIPEGMELRDFVSLPPLANNYIIGTFIFV